MPQLNTSPWFFIFLITWFIFLFILTPKIKRIKPLKSPFFKYGYWTKVLHRWWAWQKP